MVEIRESLVVLVCGLNSTTSEILRARFQKNPFISIMDCLRCSLLQEAFHAASYFLLVLVCFMVLVHSITQGVVLRVQSKEVLKLQLVLFLRTPSTLQSPRAKG
jgi:hypothetical protein